MQVALAAAAGGRRGAVGADGGWPAPRGVLLLKLWGTLFPVSDRRHPIVTPAALLTTAYLALCPIRRHHDIAIGGAL